MSITSKIIGVMFELVALGCIFGIFGVDSTTTICTAIFTVGGWILIEMPSGKD
jgi:hypothetical protein